MKQIFSNLSKNWAYYLLAIVIGLIISFFGAWVTNEQARSLIDIKNVILQRQALIVAEVMAVNVDDLSDADQLNLEITEYTSKIPELTEVSILVPRDGKFAVIASTNQDRRDTIITDEQKVKVLKTAEAVTYQKQVTSLSSEGTEIQEIFIIPTLPIKDENGDIFALLELSFATEDINIVLNIYEGNNRLFLSMFTVFAIVLILVIFRYLIRMRSLKINTYDQIQHKDELLATAAHDLGGPLIVIREDVNKLMEEPNIAPEEKQKLLLEIKNTAQYEMNFLQDLLIVSRFERGKQQVFPRPVFIQKTLMQIFEQSLPQAQTKGLELKLLNDISTLPKVIADPGKIGEVFMNYLSNAIKYSDNGSVEVRVEIKAGKKRQYIVVAVKDQGVGITEEDQKKLFKSFSRVGKTKTTHQGTGLGLYIARQIIEAHGGQVGVNSIIGQGSTFFFSLPIPSGNEIKLAETESDKQ